MLTFPLVGSYYKLAEYWNHQIAIVCQLAKSLGWQKIKTQLVDIFFLREIEIFPTRYTTNAYHMTQFLLP